jgi:hypothetical protein
MKCKSYSKRSVESEGDECIFLEQYNGMSVNITCGSYCADFQKFMFFQQRFVKKNSSTKFNKNPTDHLVAGNMLKMDR